jgi:hypothetical protein
MNFFRKPSSTGKTTMCRKLKKAELLFGELGPAVKDAEYVLSLVKELDKLSDKDVESMIGDRLPHDEEDTFEWYMREIERGEKAAQELAKLLAEVREELVSKFLAWEE